MKPITLWKLGMFLQSWSYLGLGKAIGLFVLFYIGEIILDACYA